MAAAFLFSSVSANAQAKTAIEKPANSLPALFIIGDSTVNNSSEGFQGWGNVIGEMFDRSKINVINRARGGRSSRTFQTEGLWDQVLSEMSRAIFC
jgi:rhamnogalacturonan acetylesterase